MYIIHSQDEAAADPNEIIGNEDLAAFSDADVERGKRAVNR